MQKSFLERYLRLLKDENRVNELAYIEKYGPERMPIWIEGNREELFERLLKSGKPAEKIEDFDGKIL